MEIKNQSEKDHTYVYVIQEFIIKRLTQKSSELVAACQKFDKRENRNDEEAVQGDPPLSQTLYVKNLNVANKMNYILLSNNKLC